MAQPAEKYDVFQAIADPTRRDILQLLTKGDQPIAAISAQFPMSRTAVVKHLTVLEQAYLVATEKKGREKIYTLHVEGLKEVEDWLQYFELFWDNKLSQLQRLVEEP